MTNAYNGYYDCRSCLFDCKDCKNRPCECYTPYDEDHENAYLDMLIEEERRDFAKEWESYMQGFYF